MTACYIENDAFACAWLRNLIADGLIAPGEVFERSIEDVRPDELDGFAQVHAFAGYGGWSIALQGLGIPDDFRVWTGSPPCQPWSEVGQRKGCADERHLWPAWFRLIRERCPPVVFGENVPEAVSLGWLDQISADLEAEGYAIGKGIFSACAVEAPQERERLWFVAYANGEPLEWPAIARVERHSWPAESSVARVAHGIANQRNIVRAIGNGLVIPQAQAFIEAAFGALTDV